MSARKDPTLTDCGEVLAVGPQEVVVEMDAGEDAPITFSLAQWRGDRLPIEGDRVYKVGGFDVELGQARPKWRLLPPELEPPPGILS